jgi:hypothetical protein
VLESPTEAELCDVRYTPARALAPYLEHQGDINPAGYLEAMLEAGIGPTADEPLVLAVRADEHGDRGQVASVVDGNHRLLVALAFDPGAEVPYVIARELEDLSHPGFPYAGELG